MIYLCVSMYILYYTARSGGKVFVLLWGTSFVAVFPNSSILEQENRQRCKVRDSSSLQSLHGTPATPPTGCQQYFCPHLGHIIIVMSGECSTLAYDYKLSHTFISTIYNLSNIFIVPLSPSSQNTLDFQDSYWP